MIDTDESTMLTSQLIDVVSTIPGVPDFISDRPVNVFYKHLGIVYVSINTSL